MDYLHYLQECKYKPCLCPCLSFSAKAASTDIVSWKSLSRQYEPCLSVSISLSLLSIQLSRSFSAKGVHLLKGACDRQLEVIISSFNINPVCPSVSTSIPLFLSATCLTLRSNMIVSWSPSRVSI